MEQTQPRTDTSLLRRRPRRRVSAWVKNLQNFAAVLVFGVLLGAASLFSPAVALVLALGVGVVFAALRRPIVLGYMVVLGIAFTSGMARGALVPQLKPNEILLFGSLVLALPLLALHRRGAVKVPGLLIAAQAILVLGTSILPMVSYPMRGMSLSFSELFSLAAPIQYLLLFWLFLYLPANTREYENVFVAIVAGTVVVALIGLLQAAKIGPVVSLLGTYYPSKHEAIALEYGRITSLMGAWNGLGTFLMVCLLFLFAYMQLNWSQRNKVGIIAATAICGFALLASGSFASIIGLGLGMFIISLFTRRGMKAILIVGVVLLVAGLLLSGFLGTRIEEQFGEGLVPQTFAHRIFLWQTIFIPLLGDNWLWGFQSNFESLTWQWAESHYLFLLLRSGIFSLLAHLAWLGLTLTWLYRRFKSPSTVVRSFAISLFAILISLSVMGITNEVFTYSGVIDYVWVVLGMLAGYTQERV